MSRPVVRADYEQLLTITRVFEHHSTAIEAILKQLTANTDTLRRGDWVGQGATAFYGEMDSQVLPSLKRLTRALENAAHSTQSIVQLVQQAELEAAAVFKASATSALPTPSAALSPQELVSELARAGSNFDIAQLLFQGNRALVDFFALLVKDRGATLQFMQALA
jgi:WXG100 family type VII secretion target